MHCLNLMAVLCSHVVSMDPMEHQARLDRQESVDMQDNMGLGMVDMEKVVEMGCPVDLVVMR